MLYIVAITRHPLAVQQLMLCTPNSVLSVLQLSGSFNLSNLDMALMNTKSTLILRQPVMEPRERSQCPLVLIFLACHEAFFMPWRASCNRKWSSGTCMPMKVTLGMKLLMWLQSTALVFLFLILHVMSAGLHGGCPRSAGRQTGTGHGHTGTGMLVVPCRTSGMVSCRGLCRKNLLICRPWILFLPSSTGACLMVLARPSCLH